VYADAHLTLAIPDTEEAKTSNDEQILQTNLNDDRLQGVSDIYCDFTGLGWR
jgi:hypothetical protein